MRKVLDRVLDRLVRQGSLEVVFSNGWTRRYGDGAGCLVRVRFTDASTERRLVLKPEMELGEAYMDGRLRVEQGSLYDFLALVLSDPSNKTGHLPTWMRVRAAFRRFRRRLDQRNRIARARANVAHHYDLDRRLYSLFLDEDRQYSCAYFERPGQKLENAQQAKKRHIAAKLLVSPGARLLDIGSGWGGLGLYLARVAGARVVGVTLSEEQAAISRARAEDAGLAARVDFRLQDYRTLGGRFDRIVSVGMFEHVGIGHYPEFFAKARELLEDDGVMLLHTIGRSGAPGANNPWLEKYIFPGGYIPALSEVMPAIEKSGLIVSDVEILRLHYAETLRAWRLRFLARAGEARALYGERFCRMWEFYLAGCECAFRFGDMVVFQIQMARRQDAVPLTRDYLTEETARLAAREAETPMPMRLAGE